MAEKLNEAAWTGFTKKLSLKLDDGPLLKALARFDKAPEAPPGPRQEALDELIKQLGEQLKTFVKRKKELGDKTFGELKDKLYGLQGVAESLQKEIARELAAARKSGGSGLDGDAEEDSPALLTSKMIPLIREVRKGGDLVLETLIALAGKETVVLLSRKSISPARGQLLKAQLSNASGLKFVRGQCLFEAQALTFVVEGAAAGLAKRLKAALLAQTELRLKVRVRGADSDEVEEEAEEQGEQEPEEPSGEPVSEVAPTRVEDDPLRTRYEQRFGLLEARLMRVLSGGFGDASKMRAVVGFAQDKAEAGVWPGALKALDALEPLLAAAEAAAGDKAKDPPPGSLSDDPAAAFNARLAALVPRVKAAAQEIRVVASEAGLMARKRDFEAAHELLDRVEALLKEAPPSSAPGGDVPAGKAPADRWVAERAPIVERLMAEIREVVAAKDPLSGEVELELRAVARQLGGELKTRQQAIEMQRYLEQDEVVADVSELAFDLKTPLLKVLGEITPSLPA